MNVKQAKYRMIGWAISMGLAAATVASEGTERIAIVFTWGFVLLAVAGVFQGKEQIKKVARGRITKGFSRPSPMYAFLIYMPVVMAMAFMGNMWTAFFAAFASMLSSSTALASAGAFDKEVSA